MGQDQSQIRQEIEETRAEMGDTVDALAYKTDVKTRVKESISDKRERLIEQVQGTKDKVGGSTPDGQQVKEGARQAVGVAQENPIGLAIGGVAAGFLAGMLIPSTRVEDERVGPLADRVKETARESGEAALEQGKEAAREVAEHGKEAAREVAEHGKEAAAEHGREAANETAERTREAAQQARR